MKPSPELVTRLLEALFRTWEEGGRLSVGKLSERALISREQTARILSWLGISGREFSLTEDVKIDAVLKAFEIGIDGERLSRHLAWREFEKLVNKILRRSDYQTEWNLTVTHKRERCQIDLLAYRGRIMLLIDCKHWKRPPPPSAELKMVEVQERRLRVLKKLLQSIYPPDEDFHELYLVPMVLALYQPSKRILNGHLFGSIGKLRSLIEYVESAYFHVRHEKVKIPAELDLQKIIRDLKEKEAAFENKL